MEKLTGILGRELDGNILTAGLIKQQTNVIVANMVDVNASSDLYMNNMTLLYCSEESFQGQERMNLSLGHWVIFLFSFLSTHSYHGKYFEIKYIECKYCSHM